MSDRWLAVGLGLAWVAVIGLVVTSSGPAVLVLYLVVSALIAGVVITRARAVVSDEIRQRRVGGAIRISLSSAIRVLVAACVLVYLYRMSMHLTSGNEGALGTLTLVLFWFLVAALAAALLISWIATRRRA